MAMDPFSGMEIFPSQPIDKFCPHYSASPGYDSDPNPDPDDSIVKACADLEMKISYGDIPKVLDGNYGHYVNECANQMRQNGQVQAFCDAFLKKHECDFRRKWELIGINVPLIPDDLQLKKAVDTAAKWCLACDFSDKMLNHMKEVLLKVCSSENRELVIDCLDKAAEKIMKCFLNYLAAIIKTDGAFHYFQENPSLFICILAMYELILETSWIRSEDCANFWRQFKYKMQSMLASDELLNLHNMKEACEENGGIHNNTSNFMFFIAKVTKYCKAVADIGLPNEYKTLASVGDVKIDLLQGVIPKVLSQIFSASKTLKPDLLLIVKMNNTQFISGALIRMGLGLHLQLFAYNDENIRNWIDDFVKLAWSRVGYHLNSSTGFFPICWKSPSPDIKGYIRAFHQTCLCQQDYVILDNKLRKRVHTAIINEIISPYEEVFQFSNDRERSEESNSHESLKRKVKELYERRLMNFDRLS